MANVTLYNGDCLEYMRGMAAGSVDAIICDPPYGTTACKWDTVIPFKSMWEQLKRVIKPRGAIVLFGSQPFTSALVMSNPQWFKYALVWEKERTGAPGIAHYRPLPYHEDIVVFADGATTYNPQKGIGKPYTVKSSAGGKDHKFGFQSKEFVHVNNGFRFPRSVLRFTTQRNNVHPTQKPVDLIEYLVRTYTNEGETVLDFTMGSGTTGVACVQTERNFIGCEIDEGYFNIAQRRIAEAQAQPSLFEAAD